MRSVLVIPIIHTEADLGSLAKSVKAHYLQRYGPAGWQDRERAVARIWSDIRDRLEALSLDYPRARIYQDGLPVCGYELRIVEELARAGSLNHQLVADLVRRGATLMGTEDPQLLIEEYRMHQRQLVGTKGGVKSISSNAAEEARLLSARDKFIVRRITETLQEGERGLVFLGAAHRLVMPESHGVEFRTLD